MVNPVVEKGVVPFMKVALARPDRNFLVLEGWGTPPRILELMRKIPNINYLSKQLDMRPVYSRTHVLMVPSQWEEAFGRFIPEAQVNGIPVLASRVGAIPEAVGEGGVLVDDKENPEAWLKGLELLEARYGEYSARARENAKRFSAEKAVTRLLEIIQSIQR
jgi:glycosyltransferase involved in cell wall biosynthesis